MTLHEDDIREILNRYDVEHCQYDIIRELLALFNRHLPKCTVCNDDGTAIATLSCPHTAQKPPEDFATRMMKTVKGESHDV